MMEITVLGCNGPFPAPKGATSGYYLRAGNAQIQLDLGCGTLSALTALTAPEFLDALFLTHWHYDHASDLLPLTYRLEAMGKRLSVYAPVDESSPIRQAALRCSMIELHDVAAGDVVDISGVQVQIFAARHPVPAVMLRISHEGKALCCTGDTNTIDGLAEFADHADLLLADGLFTDALWAESKPHLSASLAAQLARDAKAKQLVITHLNPTIDPATLLREARAIRLDAVLASPGARYTV